MWVDLTEVFQGLLKQLKALRHRTSMMCFALSLLLSYPSCKQAISHHGVLCVARDLILSLYSFVQKLEQQFIIGEARRLRATADYNLDDVQSTVYDRKADCPEQCDHHIEVLLCIVGLS